MSDNQFSTHGQWWNEIPNLNSSLVNVPLENLCKATLTHMWLVGGDQVYAEYKQGKLEVSADDLFAFLNTLGGRFSDPRNKVVDEDEEHKMILSSVEFSDYLRDTCLVFDNGLLSIRLTNSSHLTFYLITTTPGFVDTLNIWWAKNTSEIIQEKGNVYVFSQPGGSLEFQYLGNAGSKLEVNNYSPHVYSSFLNIIKDINSESPSGRLAIINGPPGTGKTHLIKAIIKEIEANCVIVPSHMVGSLSDPQIIPSLINLREDGRDRHKSKPIVFLIEDADNCLSHRDGMNMSQISGILNLCDGIIGSLLDIRIIATTNADRLDLDPALVRPGRLSAQVEVGKLDYEQSIEIVKRLKGDPSTLKKNENYTLAELYSLAKNGTIEPVGTEHVIETKIGF